MLGLMGFSGSLPLYVIHRYYIFVFIDRANKDACLRVGRYDHSDDPTQLNCQLSRVESDRAL